MIRRIIFLSLVISFLLGQASFAFANEKINAFNINAEILSDTSVIVKETINYDFGGEQRHGIIRDIPISYETGKGKRKIDIKVLNVLRDGVSENFETSRSGSKLSIKIGKAEETISGIHEYEINYEVKRVINYFENFDEFYWNVTGNGWQVGMTKVIAEVDLPIVSEPGLLRLSCYLGSYGSNEKCTIRSDKSDAQKILASTSRPLNPGEGMTIAIGFPKGVVREPSGGENFMNWLRDNGIVLLPILVFVFMFWHWSRLGRDPKGRTTIIAEYQPPKDMKPSLVGALVDERVDFRDITAGLIYLAEQGFVKIKRLEEKILFFNSVDYELTLLKDPDLITEQTEKMILKMFFEDGSVNLAVKLSSLKRDSVFRAKAKKLMSHVYSEMVNRGYFVKDPRAVQRPYLFTAFFIFLIGGFVLSPSFGALAVFASFISALIIIIFSFFMKKKTALGAETKDHILGFKEFLSVTEKDRLAFHNPPEKSPEQFMQFLPYAIALGVENKWAEQFKDVYIKEPNWYEGKMAGVFVASSFASDLNSFNSSVNTGLRSATAARGGAGSSGGGFSGGGFGGGGGGSW